MLYITDVDNRKGDTSVDTFSFDLTKQQGLFYNDRTI